MRDCQLSWRHELRVSPHSCLAMRWAARALCAEVAALTLCSIKRVEAIAACAKSPSDSSPLCWFRCWSESPESWSRDLADAASDDRGSGEIAPRTPEEAHISGRSETHTTQNDQCMWLNSLFQNSHPKSGILEKETILNFLQTFPCQCRQKK